MKRLALLVLVLAVGAILLDLRQRPAPVVAAPAPEAPAVEQVPGILQAVNDYRASKGLKPLTPNSKLNHSSQAKADDLVTKHYWSHVSPGGKKPWAFIEEAGYGYRQAGENLAKCYASPNALVQAWIASPTHEKVLRGDYAEVGFGSAHSTQDGCNYVVGHFGRR